MKLLPALSATHQKILKGLIAWYAVSVMLVFFLVSKALDDLTGRPAVYPGSFNTLPLLMPALLMGTLCVLYRHDVTDEDMPEPTWKQASMALYILIPVMLASFFVSHPGEEQFKELVRFVQAAPVIGGTILSGVFRTAFFLPSIPLLFAFLPFALIKKFTLPLILALGAMLLFLFANTLDSLFYDVTMPVILQLSYMPLTAMRTDIWLNAPEHLIQVGAFKAYVGPTCAGFSLLLVFMGFYALYVERLSRFPGFSAMRAMTAFPVGIALLFFLNIGRISILMLIGSWSPDAAVTIFHGAAGTLILLGVSFVYLGVVRRWIVRKK